jgi:4-amino-4-deoxy-L-arabinose transferase-like glycosyltransferase
MTATSITQLPHPPANAKRAAINSRLWLSPQGQLILLALFLAIAWILAATLSLVPDEAYYWAWSRRLAISYFDHPPMVAYLIRLGTAILGTSEFGVRWLGGIFTLAGIWILILASRDLISHDKSRAFVAVMLLVSPFAYGMAVVATPDTPAFFFQAAALACTLQIFNPQPSSTTRRNRNLWIAFGVLMGLALDSKYTAVLLGVSVLFALLSSPAGRAHLKTPWPWVAAIFVIIVFSPVIFWNASRDWASFRFQFNHGLGNVSGYNGIAGLAEYIPGQMMVATPVLFVLGMIVLVDHWRNPRSDMRLRILFYTVIVPLIFFAVSSTRRRVELNWPGFAYYPLIILLGHYFSQHWTERNAAWAKIAIYTAIGCTVGLLSAPWLGLHVPKINIRPVDDLYGWQNLANLVQSHRVTDGNSNEATVSGLDYHIASEMAFYLPDRPMVWNLPDPKRPTAFDFMPGRIPLGKLPRAVVVGKPPEKGEPAIDRRISANFAHIQIIRVDQKQSGHDIRQSVIYIGSK